jgi:CheY-like chemotaxis protein
MRKPLEILLVEDSLTDVRLTEEGLRRTQIPFSLYVVPNGQDGLHFLRNEDPFATARRPNLVLLDLNLPKVDGREVLKSAKTDPKIASIPIVVFTTSESRADIEQVYALHANSYILKPADLRDYVKTLESIVRYWGETVVPVPAL